MWPRGFVLLILAGASLAACSGSMGANSAMPQTLSSPNFGVNPTPAPSPSSIRPAAAMSSASTIATVCSASISTSS